MDLHSAYQPISINSKTYRYLSLPDLARISGINLSRWPLAARVLLEGVARSVNGAEVLEDHVAAFLRYDPRQPRDIEMPFMPARVLLQDFTGVPCVVDLAAMRSAVARLGKDPAIINPKLPVNLVIDHSVNTDHFATDDAFKKNVALEFERNKERYELLRWAQGAFENFSVIPPASGICHQVNLEYLAKVVQGGENNDLLYFDSLVGTDSHTTMINGLGVLGWGVGGIEAEAAMLGQPIYMLIPPVVGVKVSGRLRPGVTATDAVLALTQTLRKFGVVNKIVEFCGDGLASMSVPDRATLANMAPEYGATAGFFPVDARTIDYLHNTGRPLELIARVEAYYRAQQMFWEPGAALPDFENLVEFDLTTIEPSVAGPKRPQDRISLGKVSASFAESLVAPVGPKGFGLAAADLAKTAPAKNHRNEAVTLRQGDVVIASITSCTNTSSPSLLLAAGLVAKKAVAKGLRVAPYVKTSFAPGSMVVTEYLQKTGLMTYLEQLGFHLVGYGCMTCIGNSGPLPVGISEAVEANKLVVAAVLSGNRNFEGRVNPNTRANYLASPPLCVAYALAGNVTIDLETQPLGTDQTGAPVYLRDIWPSESELSDLVASALDRATFEKSYAGIEDRNPQWNRLGTGASLTFDWQAQSTYVQEPPFFAELAKKPEAIRPITDLRCLAWFGDSITTDHISPAGSIESQGPAGAYLRSQGVEIDDFNSYGSRRGNDRVMTRGTFANIRLRNRLVPGSEGGVSRHLPGTEVASIYEVANRYQTAGVPTLILAGKDYGMGSSRDWAAKGVALLGVKAVIAESYERIHRSNLVGMGVLPLEFADGATAESLGLNGEEVFALPIGDAVQPKSRLTVAFTRPDGTKGSFPALVRLDSKVEIGYYRQGGLLPAVLRSMIGL